MDYMEKKARDNVNELVQMLQKVDVEKLSTILLYEFSDRVELLKHWLTREGL